jgi:hypothetical protein
VKEDDSIRDLLELFKKYHFKKSGTMMKELLECNKAELIKALWECDPEIFSILKSSDNLHDARNKMFDYLNGMERHLYNVYSDKHFKHLNLLEKNNAKECMRVFKNVIRTENETVSNFSALNLLYKATKKKINFNELNGGFLLEFIFLFRCINGNSGLYAGKELPLFLKLRGMKAALERTKSLDSYASHMEHFLVRYKTGLDKDLIEEREGNKEFIQEFFNTGEKDWDALYPKKHRLESIYLSGKDVLEENLVFELMRKVAELFAPTVEEIKKRSPSAEELSLKVEDENGVRSEIYLKKSQVKEKLTAIKEKGDRLLEILGVLQLKNSNY